MISEKAWTSAKAAWRWQEELTELQWEQIYGTQTQKAWNVVHWNAWEPAADCSNEAWSIDAKIWTELDGHREAVINRMGTTFRSMVEERGGQQWDRDDPRSFMFLKERITFWKTVNKTFELNEQPSTQDDAIYWATQQATML